VFPSWRGPPSRSQHRGPRSGGRPGVHWHLHIHDSDPEAVTSIVGYLNELN
jgi:hypothetical protein